MKNWKPIDTAPTDGTVVWLISPLVGHPCLAKWDGSSWVMIINNRDDHGTIYHNPSHWAKLERQREDPVVLSQNPIVKD